MSTFLQLTQSVVAHARNTQFQKSFVIKSHLRSRPETYLWLSLCQINYFVAVNLCTFFLTYSLCLVQHVLKCCKGHHYQRFWIASPFVQVFRLKNIIFQDREEYWYDQDAQLFRTNYMQSVSFPRASASQTHPTHILFTTACNKKLRFVVGLPLAGILQILMCWSPNLPAWEDCGIFFIFPTFLIHHC